MELPALKKCYCYKCNKWLSNISPYDDAYMFEHNHTLEPGDLKYMVLGERRIDN